MFWIFTLCGVIGSLWSSSLPAISARLHVGETRLGIVLLLAAAGAVAVMPLTGRLCDRRGSRAVLRVGAPLSGLSLLGPALAGSFPVLLAAAFVLGAGVGRALSRVAMCGYAGELAGPAVIGPVAGATSLRVAMLVPGGLAVLITVLGPLAVLRAVRPARAAPVRSGRGAVVPPRG